MLNLFYNQLSLSQLHFSNNNRLVAQSENLVSVLTRKSNNKQQKYCGNTEQFLPFSTILLIHLKLQESNYIFICEMWLLNLFFLNLANLDMSRYRYF